MKFHSYLKTAVKTLPAKGRRNGLKIFTLGLGLAVGIVLITKVCFEFTFDDFYSDVDRIYYMNEGAYVDGKLEVYPQTPGGIAPLMKGYFSQVEMAGRYTWMESEASLKMTDSQRRITANQVYLADSCMLQILDRECLAGNITSSMGVSGNAIVSSKIAQRIASGKKSRLAAASEVIGKTFEIGSRPGVGLTIVGVYEEFPLNSSWRPDMLVSLPTIGRFMYDGSDGVAGNDRYKSFIKLIPGTDITSVTDRIEDFEYAYLPMEEMKAAGWEIKYTASPVIEWHDTDVDKKKETLVLAVVALALLFISILNYLLIVISTTVNRSREMALRKCLGSGIGDTIGMMSAESAVHTILSAGFAAILILLFRTQIQNIIGTEISGLFTGKPLIIAIAVIAAVFLINGILPAIIFNKIPVATAFRNYVSGKRSWKMILLCVEFGAVAFLGVLVSIISLQYRKMICADLGFDYVNVVKIAVPESTSDQRLVFMDELRKLPSVEDASFAFSDPFDFFSGNNVRIPEDPRDLFNVADSYYVDNHYFNVMGITLKDGSLFNEGLNPDREVIVDENFCDMMKKMVEWDETLGRELIISEHSSDGELNTVCGVVKNIKMGNFSINDAFYSNRPMVIFYANPITHGDKYFYILVKFRDLSEEALQQVRSLSDSILPDQMVYFCPLKEKMANNYLDTMNTRNSILVGSIVTLLIAILGLIGYTIDEVKRRGKEIAVRRVNGAQFAEIREMFLRDMMFISLPAIIIGCLAAAVAAQRWEQQFTVQAGLPWWVFALVVVGTLLLISLISDLYVNKLANTNPAESIKTE